jgi:hypothetical protein
MYHVTMRRSPIEGQLAGGVGVAQEAELLGAKGLYAERCCTWSPRAIPTAREETAAAHTDNGADKTIEVTKNFLTEYQKEFRWALIRSCHQRGKG